MIYQLIKNPLLFLAVFSLFIFSCQESTLEEEQSEDLDMETATQLANEHLGSSNARKDTKIAVTVFKYKNDKMYYATNTDQIKGYKELNEETITAESKPGQLVFWFGGSGISELNGIEFDETARNQYHVAPYPAYNGKLWYMEVPTDVEFEPETQLKYDILYSLRGVEGDPIRLDPKLRINQ